MVSFSASSLTMISSINSLTIGKLSMGKLSMGKLSMGKLLTALTVTVKYVSTVSLLAVPVRVIIASPD